MKKNIVFVYTVPYILKIHIGEDGLPHVLIEIKS